MSQVLGSKNLIFQGKVMSYYDEFKEVIDRLNYPKFLSLWEEYSSDEECEPKELLGILGLIKESDFADQFGSYAETALPLWKKIEDQEFSYEILKNILDLQTKNNPELAEMTYQFLKDRYGDQKYFSEKIRLIGLRTRKDFQGAIRNYELLTHLNRGRFVYHTGGWGTGEIVDISLIREELVLEFEYVGGRRSLTFVNAFKNLVPLPDEHFLSRRFGDPEKLEAEAKKDPVGVIRMVLRDLGPKTGSELKDELFELVIPKEDWSKWWQNARAKIKKDTLIEVPPNVKLPFKLREEAVSHSDRFSKSLKGKSGFEDVITTIYNFTRDYPEILKDPEQKTKIKETLEKFLSEDSLSDGHKLETLLFMDHLSVAGGYQEELKKFVQNSQDLEELINGLVVIAFKKKGLLAIRQFHEQWVDIFRKLLLSISLNPLKDYLLKELLEAGKEDLIVKDFNSLLNKPLKSPETFIWYFQKILSKKNIPFSDKEGQEQFFESLLVLLHQLEDLPEGRDLVKKIYQIISAGRYSVVRSILKDTSKEYVKEFLLLVTKCRSLSDHDIKIMHSLADVVHPGITSGAADDEEEEVIWTTQAGYDKTKDRIQEIGNVEIVANAKEIESARSHGDLRENSEYKFALEKRSRLQAELKMLSDQIGQARILTPDDVESDKVSVGCVVTLEGREEDPVKFTILGPWDADIENNILSYKSKLAQNILGKSLGEEVELQGKKLKIEKIDPYAL